MEEAQLISENLERQRRAEEGAKETLQVFVDSNYKAIGAMISYSKIIDAGGDIDPAQLGRLENFIQTESKGSLWGVDSVLCEIGESGEEFARGHHGELFRQEIDKDAKAVKGCYFSVNLEGQDFECVVLDYGRSRKYFDEMGKNERRQYMERFANRKRDSVVSAGNETLTSGFTAFLTDSGEGLVIEEVVGYRSVENNSNKK